MRKLLNTLFVLTEDSYLSLEGENVLVNREKAVLARFPLHTLEGILCFSYPGASPALMGACAERGIDLCFFTPRGRFLARVAGETRGNVLLRQAQYRAANAEAESCRFARNFLLGKVYNGRWVLERATRDHPQRVPVRQLKPFPAEWRPFCLCSKAALCSASCGGWRARPPSSISTGSTASFCSSAKIFALRAAAAGRPSTP